MTEDSAQSMPRKNSTTGGKSGQDLYKKVARALTASQKKATAKKKKLAHARELDIVARWRALNRVGVLDTKKSPALKNLTPHMRRKIQKEFNQLQGVGHYANGTVHRPLTKETYKTKSGARTRYKINRFFQVTKTKQKTDVKQGVIKTKKGYIFEKTSPDARVKIKKDKSLTETAFGVKWNRKAYKGEAILKLAEYLESGKLVLRKGQFLDYRPWGSNNYQRSIMDADLFIEMLQQYQREMTAKNFEAWLDYSEIHFAEESRKKK